MIGIKAISTHVPDRSVDNIAQGAQFGESEDFIRNKIGATRLPRMADGDETSDLAAAAVRRLFADTSLDPEMVEALIVVTQNGDGSGLPHTAAIVQSKLELGEDVAAFDVSLGCSGFVYGLSILKGLMQETGRENGVLVTADPYSKVIRSDNRVTTLLFGDAATATWLSTDSLLEIGIPLLATDGGGSENLVVIDGELRMNGRQVFNFAALRVPQQIKALLKRESLEPEDIDVYCMHQGSAAIIETIARRFPKVKDRFELDMDQVGNTVSSTIPFLLEKHIARSDVRRILICGFGVGLSWGSCILTKET